MRIRYIFVFWALCICLSSCAYYNTFYNTKKFFNEAKKERERRKGDRPSSQELQKYDKTIEKASKITKFDKPGLSHGSGLGIEDSNKNKINPVATKTPILVTFEISFRKFTPVFITIA